MDNLSQVFNASLQTGFIDKTILSNISYQPELLVNKKNPPKKILSTLIHEFEICTEFFINVAFATTSGVATLINTLKELENRGIKGKILVSQFLNFTEPEALKRLAKFKNINIRIATKGNAHAKGYIFKNKEHYNLIVGSSNLTAQFKRNKLKRKRTHNQYKNFKVTLLKKCLMNFSMILIMARLLLPNIS